MAKQARGPSHFIGEWFGHRVYPTVVSSAEALADQQNQKCPFLSRATATETLCLKSSNSRGVCTVTSHPSGPAQEDPQNPENPANLPGPRDWLVCPYRVLDPVVMESCVGLLFGFDRATSAYIIPAIRLGHDRKKKGVAPAPDVIERSRSEVLSRLRSRERVFIYFDDKLGGELSMPGTGSSPEFSFDVTVFELVLRDEDVIHVDRFGIVEIQTMDFHGTYQHAVRNLTDAVRMYGSDFPEAVQKRQSWLSEKMEGPNIANVFKRTFYQMMFKFQLADHPMCAGCVLAIPESVWDSWGPHLANPQPTKRADGTYDLFGPGKIRPTSVPAWVFVFGLDHASRDTPSPVDIRKIIATDSSAMSHHALVSAPANSLSSITSHNGMLALAKSRIAMLWPELAASISVDQAPSERKAKPRPTK